MSPDAAGAAEIRPPVCFICQATLAEEKHAIKVGLSRSWNEGAIKKTQHRTVPVPACAVCKAAYLRRERKLAAIALSVWAAPVAAGFFLSWPDAWGQGLFFGFGLGYVLAMIVNAINRARAKDRWQQYPAIQELVKGGWSKS